MAAGAARAGLDNEGHIVGGLIGELHWGWLRISVLAVAERLAAPGWGRRLVEEAERRAVAAGCRRAWVDTFTFQAPGFYERLGYRAFGELPDYPPGEGRVFLMKEWMGDEKGSPAPPRVPAWAAPVRCHAAPHPKL